MNPWFQFRVACHRARHRLQWMRDPQLVARGRARPTDHAVVVTERSSPLKRAGSGLLTPFTDEKTHNLQLAAAVVARASEPLPCRTTIVETDDRFFRRNGTVHRANRLWKEIDRLDGTPPPREPLFETECRVLYPADHLLTEELIHA